LLLFVLHFAVRVWTLAYFAPNIIWFQKIANSTENAFLNRADLQKKVKLWQQLNYLRMGLFIAISMGLIPLFYQLIHLKKGLN
jgi:hypothetical protein